MNTDRLNDIAAAVLSFPFTAARYIKALFGNYLMMRRGKVLSRRMNELSRRFDIDEHDGRLYLTLDCVAIDELPREISAGEIALTLSRVRTSAIRYSILKQTTSR